MRSQHLGSRSGRRRPPQDLCDYQESIWPGPDQQRTARASEDGVDDDRLNADRFKGYTTFI